MRKSPQQARAVVTENKFLDAFSRLLETQSFQKTTVDQIALSAGLHRGAFLKRFGSKKGALLALWERYCQLALDESRRLSAMIDSAHSAVWVCEEMSQTVERIQTQYFSSNRAMHELFLESLKTDVQTREIFMSAVEIMRGVQKRFLPAGTYSDTGAFAASQLCTSINYNYVLKAMPALPRNPQNRHRLIAESMCLALKL